MGLFNYIKIRFLAKSLIEVLNYYNKKGNRKVNITCSYKTYHYK